MISTSLSQCAAPAAGVIIARSAISSSTRFFMPLIRPFRPCSALPLRSLYSSPRLINTRALSSPHPRPSLSTSSRVSALTPFAFRSLHSAAPSSPSSLPSLRAQRPLPASLPPCLFLVPVRHQQQHARGGRGDNQALFQLVLVGVRFVARSLPFLWRSGRVQQFYHRYPKSVLLLLVIPAVLTAAFLASHASLTPYSNRLHFTFLGSEAEMNLGQQAYAEVVNTEKERLLPPNDPTVQQVKEVASRILGVAVADGVVDGKAMRNWTVNVIESGVANAFVLPNGAVFVYTGILPICKTEAGLATVLGHEVSHALAHHSVEKMGVVSILLIAYDFARGWVDSANPNGGLASTAVSFLLTTLAQMVLPLAHSRKMEVEADDIGLLLMAKAGYDPHAGIDVWTRMTAAEEQKKAGGAGRMPEFLSSHPSSQHRVERMKTWAEERTPLYQAAVEKARREGRRPPSGDRPLQYHPTRSASALARMDEERSSAATSFEASSLAVGDYKGIVNLRLT